MNIGMQKFGMNFTSIRIREDTLLIYGETAGDSDPADEIGVVVFRPGNDPRDDARFTRVQRPQERAWSARLDAAAPYARDDEVYVVGLATRSGETAPHVWRNHLQIKSFDEEVPSSPAVDSA